MSRKKPSRKPQAVDAPAKPADPFRGWLLAAMAALLTARLLYPSESVAAEGDGLPVVMLWLTLAVVWLVSIVHKSRFAPRFGAVDAAVLAILAWVSVSGLYAVAHASPRPSLNMLWEWIGLGLVYFLSRQLVVTPRESRAVAAAMVSVMVAISAYSVYQYTIELPALQSRFKNEGDALLKEVGLSFPVGTPLRDLLEKRLDSHAAIGTFAESNSLAAAVAPWLVIGAGILIVSWARSRDRYALLACLLPLGTALALTKSRSGWIAVGVGVLWLAAMLLRFRPRHIIAGAIFACATIAVACFALHAQPWFVRAANSFLFRVQYWQGTLAMIRARPWLGCGPGNFQEAYTQFKLPQASEEVADPHNFPLEIWATAGTPALMALVGIFALFARNIVSLKPAPVLASENDQSKPIPFGVIVGFLLAWPLGQICSAPPSLAVTVIGLPVATVCLWLLRNWVREGQFPPGLFALGLVVLLIALLTTEGMGIPAIAQSLWLLLAMGLSARAVRDAPRRVAVALLAAGLGLTIACFVTSYSRVLPCQSFMRLAKQSYFDGELDEAREAAEHAAAADPQSSEAHDFLALIDLRLWSQSRDAANYAAFERHDELARQLAPQSATVWHGSAMRYQMAATAIDDKGHPLAADALAHAVTSARRVVAIYPNSGLEHASLAMLYQQSGDEPNFHREARTALELDDVMTHEKHEDKKLPAELRRKLEAAMR